MKNKPSNKIAVRSVSVKGSLHLNKKMPCQDYCKHSQGKNFVAVVSDGAGSAPYSHIGAKIVCETLCDTLKNANFSRIKENILNSIKIAREKLMLHRLNKAKNEENINIFAATVVGVVYHKGQGMFFHIGDGAGIAFKDDNCSDFVMTRPENGSWSCETFFYTMKDWDRNLRFTPFEKTTALLLMTDGLTGFAFSNDFCKIEDGFVKPIHDFLSNEQVKSKAVRALNNTLNTPKAQKLNVDDKTLLWAKL